VEPYITTERCLRLSIREFVTHRSALPVNLSFVFSVVSDKFGHIPKRAWATVEFGRLLGAGGKEFEGWKSSDISASDIIGLCVHLRNHNLIL
jgi:hypothetical protein